MKREKILIIDDNIDHRNAAQFLLEKEEYFVIAANNGTTGLKILNEHDDIRIIIVDLAMLELSGVEVLKIIKDRKQPLRRIVLTAYDGELSFTEAKELKVFSYLNKPITKHILLFTVKSALNDLYVEEAKQWKELGQSAGDFVQTVDNKINQILTQIDLIKDELKNINAPTQSRFDEITKNVNQILTLKGEISTKFHNPGISRKPRIFIGSSKESLKVAYAVELRLKDDAEVKVWRNCFKPGSGILDTLIDSLHEYDFAIFILGADDFIISRGIPSKIPRDNIFFEIGLFMGHIGRSRVFLVYDSNDDIKIPSDFAGIELVPYDGNRTDRSIGDAVSPACTQIMEAMDKCL
jgi:predicted nucleotide-binding protein